MPRPNKFTDTRVADLPMEADIRTCEPTTTLAEAIEILQRRRVGSVVIVDDERPVGIFTERDLLMKIIGQDIDMKNTGISEYMTPDPVSVAHDAPLIEALRKMRNGKFRHLVVIDEDGDLTNVLSIKDVMDYLVDLVLEP